MLANILVTLIFRAVLFDKASICVVRARRGVERRGVFYYLLCTISFIDFMRFGLSRAYKVFDNFRVFLLILCIGK